MKKTSAAKSETHFSREAFGNERGKVLKESSSIPATQNYTDNADGNVALTVQNV